MQRGTNEGQVGDVLLETTRLRSTRKQKKTKDQNG